MEPTHKAVALMKVVALIAAGCPAVWSAGSARAQLASPPHLPQIPQTGKPSDRPPDLLHQAIRLVEGRRSISAKVWQRAELFGKQLEGSGIYLEQRSEEGLQLRLELKFPLDGEPCVLLQVCNGRYLWRYEKFGAAAKLERIDTWRVLQALEERGPPSSEASLPPWPGWGGVPRLLRALQCNFDFSPPQAAELPGGFPTLRLEGQWKSDRLAALYGGSHVAAGQGRAGDLGALPPQAPHHVMVYLGRDDLFPYRIEFRRSNPSNRNSGRTGRDPIMAVMELREVVFNVPIAREQFHYDPGTLEYTEQTDRFLESLGVAH